jgi:hypothetical protein
MAYESPIDICFDIEVAGLEWEEVDELTRGYLLERERDEAKRAAVPESTALHLGLGKIIAIGMWNLATDRGALLLEGASAGNIQLSEYERMPGCHVGRGTESELLRKFWDITGPTGRRKRLISFNGRGYDIPHMAIRSAMHQIRPSRPLETKPWDRDSHIDLMDILCIGNTGSQFRYKLDYWCRRFDIESPKTKLDGSQVARAYREKKIEDIGEYCLRDTRATAELYRKIKPSLIDL